MIPFPILSNTQPMEARYYKTFGTATATLGLLVKDRDNTLYVMGQKGKLGLGVDFTNFVTMETNVEEFWCTDNYGLIKKYDGTYWISGENFFGTAANNAWTNYTSRFNVIPGDIKKIVGCRSGLYVLNSLGDIYGVTYNNYGSMGTGSSSPPSYTTFTKLSAYTDVKDIYSAWGSAADQLYVMKNDGSVWGSGYNGYLTMGAIGGTVLSPVQISTALGPCKDFKATLSNAFFQKMDGTWWANGSNLYGQYGNGGTHGDSPTHEQLIIGDGSVGIAQLFVNNTSTYVIGTDGKLYYAGYSTSQFQISFSNIASFGNTNVTTFGEVPGWVVDKYQIKASAAVSSNSAYLLSDNALYGCGYSGAYELLPSYGYNKTILGMNVLVTPAFK